MAFEPGGPTITDVRCAAVLICTMDRPAALGRCLDAILTGTVVPSTLVVVDQSRAPAASAAAVARAGAAARGCRVVRVPSSGGMARGQNEGFARIVEDVVLVTDDDCVPAPDWLERATDLLERRPELAVVGGRVLPLPVAGPAVHPVASRTATKPVELDHRSDPWVLGSGNNFAVRRQAVLAAGGNDERLGPGARFGGGADIDLFRRLLRAGGGRGRYDPGVVVFHERATAHDHRRRRVPYGYGVGLASVLWWRQGDRRAVAIGGRYAVLRLRRARAAARARDLHGIASEALVLWGAARGAARGLVVRDAGPVHPGLTR